MASYLKAGVFLDHWIYGNVCFLGNENLKGNEDIHGIQSGLLEEMAVISRF